MSKPKIRQELNFNYDRFDAIASKMEEEQFAQKGKGKGGTFHLLQKGKDRAQKLLEKYTRTTKNEKELYEHFDNYLAQTNSDAARILDIDNSSSKSKGKWRNPDFCRVEIKVHDLIPGYTVYVSTYEIKPINPKSTNWDIVGIYEAAAHFSMANESYLVLEMPYDSTESGSYSEELEKNLGRIKNECSRHGIGLMKMLPQDFDGKSWDCKVELISHTNSHPTFVIDDLLTRIISNRDDLKVKFKEIIQSASNQTPPSTVC